MLLIRSHRVYLFEKCIIVRCNKFDGSDLGGEIAMWFWWFMLVCDLLTPIVMIITGRMMWKHCPKQINSLMGYRTALYEEYGYMEICQRLLRTALLENWICYDSSLRSDAYSVLSERRGNNWNRWNHSCDDSSDYFTCINFSDRECIEKIL